MIKSCVNFILTMIIGTSGIAVFSQESYSLVSKKEYEEYYEKPNFIPDARIHGEFNLHFDSLRGTLWNGAEDSDNYSTQNFILNFKSEVNRDVSVNFGFSNAKYYTGDNRGSYYSLNKSERESGANAGDKDIQLVVNEAYLEYNHNPSAKLKFGIQEIAIGDRIGLVYRGKNSAITWTCGIGTWCLDIGGAKIGSSENDTLYWFELDYPVYDSSKTRKDLFHKKSKPLDKLNVELYRVIHTQFDRPLAKYGGQTWASLDTPNDFQVTSGSECVYFDTRQEYYGFSVQWDTTDIALNVHYIQEFGENTYYTGSQSSTVTALDDQSNYGALLFFDGTYYIQNDKTLGFEYLTASGNRDKTGEAWEHETTAFYEVNKGTFGKAIIYFSGYDGTGEGHTLSNVTFWSVKGALAEPEWKMDFLFQYYDFKKTEPVLKDGDEVIKIGTELDFTWNWYFKENLKLISTFSAFDPDVAYVKNDNSTLTGNIPDVFSHIGITINYTF